MRAFPSPMIRGALLALLLPLLMTAAPPALAASEAPRVLTSIGPLRQIAAALLEDTGIGVASIPEQPRSLAAQPAFFRRQAEAFADSFQAAEAVVTLGKLWEQDPFYTTARSARIRTVNIDASKPWSFVHTGIPVALSPVSGEPSPYFWTSPSNLIRSLTIVARDLAALFPEHAERIEANLEREREAYLALKADFDSRFLEVADPLIYALTEDFIHLTRDLGLFVDGYFVKQDIDWTPDDLAALGDTLRQRDIGVVIHQWEPAEEIRDAVEAAGAELVVLDLMETETEGLREGVRANMEKLLEALL